MSIFGEVESGQLLGNKTCPSYWACSVSLRNPHKFQNIHPFSKIFFGRYHKGNNKQERKIYNSFNKPSERREEEQEDQRKRGVKREESEKKVTRRRGTGEKKVSNTNT
jgi:hypothetical protein